MLDSTITESLPTHLLYVRRLCASSNLGGVLPAAPGTRAGARYAREPHSTVPKKAAVSADARRRSAGARSPELLHAPACQTRPPNGVAKVQVWCGAPEGAE